MLSFEGADVENGLAKEGVWFHVEVLPNGGVAPNDRNGEAAVFDAEMENRLTVFESPPRVGASPVNSKGIVEVAVEMKRMQLLIEGAQYSRVCRSQ